MCERYAACLPNGVGDLAQACKETAYPKYTLEDCERAVRRFPEYPHYHYSYGRVLYALKRYSDAAEQWTQADQGGYILASYSLGGLYWQGLGVVQNFGYAVGYYKKAAAAGIPLAIFNLGVAYENGQGVPKDPVEAASLYAVAADKNLPEGIYALAWLYSQGKGVKKNESRASELLAKAAKAGFAPAQLLEGDMSANGPKPDYGNALAWYKLASTSADPDIKKSATEKASRMQQILNSERSPGSVGNSNASSDDWGKYVVLGGMALGALWALHELSTPSTGSTEAGTPGTKPSEPTYSKPSYSDRQLECALTVPYDFQSGGNARFNANYAACMNR
jgi:tetratricopeptide (TPR) repeat protein